MTDVPHHPTREDAVAAAFSEVVGGPYGAHAGGRHWWTPLRVSLAAATAVTAGSVLVRGAGLTDDLGAPPGLVARPVSAVEELAGSSSSVVWALLLAGLVLLTTWWTGTADRRHPWAAASWALAPVLVLHWASWDLLAAAAVAAAAWGLLRGRWVEAGGAAVLAAVLVATTPGRWEAAGTGSPWLLVDRWTAPPVAAMVAVSFVLVVLALGAAAWMARPATGRAAALPLAVVGLAAALATTPSLPATASLLVLPVAALAVRQWRDLLVWQACEVIAWAVTWAHVAGHLAPSGGGESGLAALAIVLRMAGLAWLGVAAVRQARADTAAYGPAQVMTTRSTSVAV